MLLATELSGALFIAIGMRWGPEKGRDTAPDYRWLDARPASGCRWIGSLVGFLSMSIWPAFCNRCLKCCAIVESKLEYRRRSFGIRWTSVRPTLRYRWPNNVSTLGRRASVGQTLVYCWLTVGVLSAQCWIFVGSTLDYDN